MKCLKLIISSYRNIDGVTQKTKVSSITLLMFDIDISSMFAKISIENLITICVPQ